MAEEKVLIDTSAAASSDPSSHKRKLDEIPNKKAQEFTAETSNHQQNSDTVLKEIAFNFEEPSVEDSDNVLEEVTFHFEEPSVEDSDNVLEEVTFHFEEPSVEDSDNVLEEVTFHFEEPSVEDSSAEGAQKVDVLEGDALIELGDVAEKEEHQEKGDEILESEAVTRRIQAEGFQDLAYAEPEPKAAQVEAVAHPGYSQPARGTTQVNYHQSIPQSGADRKTVSTKPGYTQKEKKTELQGMAGHAVRIDQPLEMESDISYLVNKQQNGTNGETFHIEDSMAEGAQEGEVLIDAATSPNPSAHKRKLGEIGPDPQESVVKRLHPSFSIRKKRKLKKKAQELIFREYVFDDTAETSDQKNSDTVLVGLIEDAVGKQQNGTNGEAFHAEDSTAEGALEEFQPVLEGDALTTAQPELGYVAEKEEGDTLPVKEDQGGDEHQEEGDKQGDEIPESEADAGGCGVATAQVVAAPEQFQLEVPNDRVCLIIGEKGHHFIRSIQTKTGVHIQVIPQVTGITEKIGFQDVAYGGGCPAEPAPGAAEVEAVAYPGYFQPARTTQENYDKLIPQSGADGKTVSPQPGYTRREKKTELHAMARYAVPIDQPLVMKPDVWYLAPVGEDGICRLCHTKHHPLKDCPPCRICNEKYHQPYHCPEVPCDICFKKHRPEMCPYFDSYPKGALLNPGYQVVCPCGNLFDEDRWVCTSCYGTRAVIDHRSCFMCNVLFHHCAHECPVYRERALELKDLRDKAKEDAEETGWESFEWDDPNILEYLLG